MRILVFGAGSTGCYLSALFSLSGIDTHIVARPRIIDELTQAGSLSISAFTGTKLNAALPAMHTALPAGKFDLCFVTLKCHHLPSAATDLVKLRDQGCELHFLQNGLNSRKELDALNKSECYTGIIPFNVLSMGNGEFHQGTEGALQLQTTALTESLKQQLQSQQLLCELFQDIEPVMYGKLLLNLNNALNAISDLPLKQELENRQIRKVLAGAMDEYLAFCSAKNVSLHISSPIPALWLPRLLRLPNWLFTRIAKKMITIDPLARSSMWEDLELGRPTEIDFLNGAVAKLCEEQGLPSPINREIAQLIKQDEQYTRNKKPGKAPGLESLFKLI